MTKSQCLRIVSSKHTINCFYHCEQLCRVDLLELLVEYIFYKLCRIAPLCWYFVIFQISTRNVHGCNVTLCLLDTQVFTLAQEICIEKESLQVPSYILRINQSSSQSRWKCSSATSTRRLGMVGTLIDDHWCRIFSSQMTWTRDLKSLADLGSCFTREHSLISSSFKLDNWPNWSGSCFRCPQSEISRNCSCLSLQTEYGSSFKLGHAYNLSICSELRLPISSDNFWRSWQFVTDNRLRVVKLQILVGSFLRSLQWSITNSRRRGKFK